MRLKKAIICYSDHQLTEAHPEITSFAFMIRQPFLSTSHTLTERLESGTPAGGTKETSLIGHFWLSEVNSTHLKHVVAPEAVGLSFFLAGL